MKGLERLEAWYAARCNGDWEHRHGVDIGTLDNPGWRVTIDLTGTSGENRVLDNIQVTRTETDWIAYWIENQKFHAACGPRNLSEAIDIFCDWYDALG